MVGKLKLTRLGMTGKIITKVLEKPGTKILLVGGA